MKSWCCYIDEKTGESCHAKAEWELRHGHGIDDYTHCCTEHVGVLLTDAAEHRIYPLGSKEFIEAWHAQPANLSSPDCPVQTTTAR